MVDLEKKHRRSFQSYADAFLWRLKAFGKWLLLSPVTLVKLLWKEFRYSWVGFQMIFGAWKDWVLMTKRTEMLNDKKRLAVKQGLLVDTKEWKTRDDTASDRVRLTLVGLGLSALGILIGWWLVGSVFFIYLVGGLALICELVGHTKSEPVEFEPMPTTALEPGVSIKKLQTSIAEILSEAKPPVAITFHGQTWYDHGVELDCHTSDKVTDDHLRTLERHLQAGAGMVTLVRNRRNSAAPKLRLFWHDPLSGAVTPATRAPKSLSCADPFDLTRTDTGGRGTLNVLGVHQFWVGRSGSGKSSGLWTLLDWLVDCYDAEVFCIDRTNGPVFGAYARVVCQVAYDAETAHEILDESIRLCVARNEELNAGMDDDEDGLVDENYVVSNAPGKRARFIVIDEYTALAADDELREKVEKLYEIGRKARVHVIVSSPSADKRGLKSTVPINQSMTKVIFGIPFVMIAHVLGVGFSDDGYRPDRFDPASNDNPADSGKAYIYSAESATPIVQRFDRLTPEDIRSRNRVRRAYLAQTVELPEVLGLLRSVFEAAGYPDHLRTVDIVNEQWTDRKLAAASKPFGIKPETYSEDGKQLRGYAWGPINQALRKYL